MIRSLILALLFLVGAPTIYAQCGIKNDSRTYYPSDYLTKAPPQKGNSYKDIKYGCLVTQMTDAFTDNGVATTGSISAGSTSLKVASSTSFAVNRGVCILGAGTTPSSLGKLLVTYPSKISEGSVTLNDAATQTVTSANIFVCPGFEGHEYTMSPFSRNDCFEIILNSWGSYQSIEATGRCGIPAGTILVNDATIQMGASGNSGSFRWRQDDPNSAIYIGDSAGHGKLNQVMRYHIYTATGSITGAKNSIEVSSAAGLANGAEIIIFGAGASGAKLTTTVSSFTGSTVTLSSKASTTVTNAIVVLSYSTVQHTFREYTSTGTGCNDGSIHCGVINFGGSHGGINASSNFVAMEGQLSSGLWQTFAYDYVNDVKHTATTTSGRNSGGFTLHSSATSGASHIAVDKASGTGGWACLINQSQICQFQIAGDPQVYTCYFSCNRGYLSFAPGSSNTVISDFTPALSQNELSGAPVSVYFKPNGSTAIGTSWMEVGTPSGTTNSGFTGVDGADLFSIEMSYIRNAFNYLLAGHGNTGIDPVSGDPMAYAADSGDNACPSKPHAPITGVQSTGIAKVDMLTGAMSCLDPGVPYGVAMEGSISANSKWFLASWYDANLSNASLPFLACTACLAADLPANPSSRWGYGYNELHLINTVTGDIFRLAYTYARVLNPGGLSYQYWSVPRCALSYDASLAACDSNYDMSPPMDANVTSEPYEDSYIINTGIETPSAISVGKLPAIMEAGLTLAVAPQDNPLEIITAALPIGRAGVASSFTLAASGGSMIDEWRLPDAIHQQPSPPKM